MAGAVIFQAVPSRWRRRVGLQPYLEQSRERRLPIYWSTPPKRRDEIYIRQRAYLWRSKSDLGPRGIIAVGEVVELPALSGFEHPERVHAEGDEGAESSDWKTGVCLTDVRWIDRMLTADALKAIVPRLQILVNAHGTVFVVDAHQSEAIEKLWDASPAASKQ